MRIIKEEAELAAIDLAALTQRETEAILSGAEPTACSVRLLWGDVEVNDSHRRHLALECRKDAVRRLNSGLLSGQHQERWDIHNCIQELDQFVEELSAKEVVADG